MSQLEDLLQQCTVKLTLPGRVLGGTGFFVAPGWILTCAHVVKEAKGQSVQVCWQAQDLEVIVDQLLPTYDLALLRLVSTGLSNVPCVYLGEEFSASHRLYAYGYSDEFPEGASLLGECEGTATENNSPLILFKATRVRSGMSGSPLLNQQTGKVCGMVKFTRDRSIDLGGGAVPAAVILARFPELVEQQRSFHQEDKRWSRELSNPNVEPQEQLSERGHKRRWAPQDHQRFSPKFAPGSIVDLEGAADITTFLGREEELKVLTNWIIKDRCRLISLLGIGGIGKTSLISKLATKHQKKFDHVIWRSVKNAQTFESILVSLIQSLFIQGDVEMPSGLDSLVLELLRYLQKHRCLLIFDNLETVFQQGKYGCYRNGYEMYGELFNKIGKTDHQSCLVITSREQPRDLAALSGTMLPIRSFCLGGLKNLDGQKILIAKGIRTLNCENESKKLIDLCGGNPLIIKLISATVQDLFGGNITAFLSQKTLMFEDVIDLLEQQFIRLSEVEQRLMYWLALYREPASIEDLSNDIFPKVTQIQLLEALQSLRRRSLIEALSTKFTQQSVVMEYVTEKLIEKILQEVYDGALSFIKDYIIVRATAEDYIRESQFRLIVEPTINRLVSSLGSKEQVVYRFAELIAVLRQESLQEQRYSVGNILNLLCYLEDDIEEYNLSHLSICQAYLQNKKMRKVDFTNSSFSNCIFTKTFGVVLSTAFSCDGLFVAMGGVDGRTQVWRVVDEGQVFNHSGNDWVWAVTFHPQESSILAASNGHSVELWNVETGQCINKLEGHTDKVMSIAFNLDGSIIASSGHDKTIKLWSTTEMKCLQTLDGHSNRIMSVAFSSNSQILASGSDDQTIKLWDVESGQCFKALFDHQGWIWSLAFNSSDQTLISSSQDGSVKLWNPKTGYCLRSYQGYTNQVSSVAVSSCNQMIASSNDGLTTRIWNSMSGECSKVLIGHSSWIWSTAFSSDGKHLATGSEDKTVRLWDVASGACLAIFRGHTLQVRSVAFAPDGKTIFSGSADKTIRIWNIKTQQCVTSLEGHSARVWCMSLSHDGLILASGSEDQTIKLWNVDTGRCLKTLTEHTGWIWSITFSPNSKMLVSSSTDQTVKLWDATSGRCIKTIGKTSISQVRNVAFSPDGLTIAIASDDRTIKLWDSYIDITLKVLSGHNGVIEQISFGSDSSILCSGSRDGTVRLWNTTTGECVRILKPERPYEQMNITGVSGLSESQKLALKSLGAFQSF